MRIKTLATLSLFIAGCFFINSLQAQTIVHEDVPGTFSIGTSLGLSDLWGDIGTQSVMDHYMNGEYTKKLYSVSGLFARVSFFPALAARLSLNYGMLSATDKFNYKKAKEAASFNDDAVQRYLRNQDVRTNIWETSFMVEFMPLRLSPESKIARWSTQPFVAVGFGYYHFQPTTRIGNEYTKIYDLNIEANGAPGNPPLYKLWQTCIPMGMGVKFDIKNHMNIGVEWMYRMCSTDYLDGVSNKYVDPAYYDLTLPANKAGIARAVSDKSGQVLPGYSNAPGSWRGNPANNDSYSTIAITIYYKIIPRGRPWWGEYY